jgi:hypothetical protein
VLTFSAAAFEEFRVIAKNIFLSSGLNINQTNTADLKGVTVSESLEVKNGREKIFVINFYNSTSRVLLNGNHVHISEFVSTRLRDQNVGQDFIVLDFFVGGDRPGGKGVCVRLMSPAHETQSMREIRLIRGRLPIKS